MNEQIRRMLRGIAVGVSIAVVTSLIIISAQETQGRMLSDLMESPVIVEHQDPLPEELREENLGKFKVTYYDLDCETCQTDQICANGEKGVPYVTLATSNAFPFGTRLKLIYPDGSYRIGVVMDRGGAIQGNRIDVLVETHEQAVNMGVSYVDVVII